MSEYLENNTKNNTEDFKSNVNIFEFIKSPNKLTNLIQANEILNINKNKNNTLVFVYSAPKVGSTSIVSSFRLFGIDRIDIIHIHDEEMLRVLGKITDITINEIILFNKYLGKDIYVINVYRSPIERKISTFFEKIGAYHFNAEDNEVNTYNIVKVINRFNNIFPWIGNGDHYIDKYNIKIPEKFDFINKYVLVKENDIKYITLRLKDSNEWGNILTNIFGFNIRTIKDYESSNKPIKDLYNRFKLNYRIPINLLNILQTDMYLNYYYSELEINSYYNEWLVKSSNKISSYTYEQYKLYESISIENCHVDKIQLDHYFDEGCTCKACSIKRCQAVATILNGIDVKERIIHSEAKSQLIQRRIEKVNRINHIMNNMQRTVRGKDFKKDMKSIVSKSNIY